jgi:quinoprotein glucose dehydrogenase
MKPLPRPHILLQRAHMSGLGRFMTWALALVQVVLGAVLLWLGFEIATTGGGYYYLAAAVLLLVGAICFALDRLFEAFVASAALLLLTFIWGLWEIAGNGWMVSWPFDLAGRIAVPGILFVMVLLTLIFGTLRIFAPHWFRPFGFGGVLAATAIAGALVGFFWERSVPPRGSDVIPTAFDGHNTAEEWSAYGGSALGAGYSPAVEVTRSNIGNLEQVWEIQTGDLPPNDRVSYSAQNTPIYVENRLYACTPSNQVLALDPANGETIWRFDPETSAADMESLFSTACRAVAHHRQEGATGLCAAQIYVTTVDSRLYALDSATGEVCPDFGDAGVVDLALGMGMQETGLASSTSGPAVVGDLVIIGQQVSDNQRRDAPSGVVRAYDAVSGDLIWAWDALRQGIASEPLPEGEIYPRGTPNVWNIISGDAEAGLIYVGTGNSANDHWGGTRTEEEDRFTAAIVAIDAATGETIWDFATVIHDLWDYDLGAQPVVMDLTIDGQQRRVVVQGTKQGSVYVLDAATGEAVQPIEMQPAPQGALPGDWVAEAQPISTAYPNFAGRIGPEPEVLNHSQTWGVAMIDAALCRRDFLRMDYRGIYTPPSENPHGMLLHPGTVGGINWGGLGVDLGRQIMVTNHSRLPNVVTMHPREEVDDLPVGMGGARPDQEIAPHWLSPWGVTRPMWLSVLGAPCIAPPWGLVAATDLDSGALLWSHPLGTGFDTGPMNLPTFLRIPLGTVNLGGPLVTGSGVTFIAAAQDNFLRAYETETGRLIWSARLPAGGQASPMTYVHEGRQYVVIVAAGHAQLQTTIGDYILAFALPET